MSEAHARAHPTEQPKPPEEKPPVPEEQPPSPPESKQSKPPVHNHSGAKGQQEGIFSTLFRDKDKTIILALMLLLADENGDNSLLFALMYLLMD